MNKKRKQKKVSFFIILAFLMAPIFFINDITPVLAAEEDEEDNFTSMPNWRWQNQSITDAGVNESLLGNDFYQVDLSNLDPDDSIKFEKSRQLIDRDFYVDQKWQMDLGGNQAELFRDMIGDACDFEEDVEEFSTGIMEAGILIKSGLARYSSVARNVPEFSTDGSNNWFYEVRIKTSVPISDFRFILSGEGGWVNYHILDVSTEWEIISGMFIDEYEDYPDYRKIVNTVQFTPFGDVEYPITLYLDYVKLFTALDYATHTVDEIEDTWDWEDSKEYFYDVESDISDFNEPEDYWYDNDGDVVDFAEGDLEGFGGAGVCTLTLDDGWLKTNRSASNFLYAEIYSGETIDTSVYKYVKIKVMPISDSLQQFQVFNNDGSDSYGFDNSGWAVNQSHVITINVSADADWTGTLTNIRFRFQMSSDTGDNRLKIDLVYLLESETGDTELWQARSGYPILIRDDNGWLELSTVAANQQLRINTTGISVDASVYKWLTIEWYLETTVALKVNSIGVYDGGTNSVYQDGSSYENNTRNLMSADLSNDADWTGTETDLYILFQANISSSAWKIHLNFTFLYDMSLGDREDFVGLSREYVNPVGYYTGTTAIAASVYLSISTVVIPVGTFNNWTIKLRSLSDVRFRFRARKADSSTYYPEDNAATTATAGVWYTRSFDLTSNNEELQDVTRLYIYVYDYSGGGDLDGDEIIQIDYVHVTGNFSPSPIKFSLLNAEDEEGAYIRFSRLNGSNNTYLMEIDFLDSVGVALDYSTMFDYSLDDGWLFLEMNLNINKKRLKIDFEYENGTDILKIRSFYELYGQMGTPVLLISKIGDPQYCMNFSQESISHAYVIIDYIDADWTTIDWVDPDYEFDIGDQLGAWQIWRGMNNLSADSLTQYSVDGEEDYYSGGAVKAGAWFYLDIDRFDGVSFDIVALTEDMEGDASGWDQFAITATMANVMPNGSLDFLSSFAISMSHDDDGAFVQTNYMWYYTSSRGSGYGSNIDTWGELTGGGSSNYAEASVSFYFDSKGNELIGQASCVTNDGTEVMTSNVSRPYQLTSEMVLFFCYTMWDGYDAGNPDHYKASIGGFDLIRKGWLEDIVGGIMKGIAGILGFILSPFIMFFTFILNGLVLLGKMIVQGLEPFLNIITTVLGAAITAMQIALGAAIDGLGAAFGIIIDGLEIALVAALGVLETAIEAITTALGNLAGQIWSAFLGLVAELSALLEDLLLDAISWIGDAIDSFINDFLLSFLAELIEALGLTEFIAFIADFVTDLLSVLGYILILLGSFLGWFFEMALYWLNPIRMQAVGLWLFAGLMIWLIYPLVVLFVMFVDGDYDSDKWIEQFELFFNKLFAIMSVIYTVLVFVVELTLKVLTTIGNWVPFT